MVRESETMYLGYEMWLPNPPKVEKPRSAFNSASLAYIEDYIYELYARRHFLVPPLNIEEYNDRVMAVIRCEAQDVMLQKRISEAYLSAEERKDEERRKASQKMRSIRGIHCLRARTRGLCRLLQPVGHREATATNAHVHFS